MKIRRDKSGTIVCTGSMVISEIESIHSALEPMLDAASTEVILDLSKVDEIDLSGLQILYAIRKTFEAEGVFHIRAVSEAVRETIALSGYGRFFKEVVS